MEKNVMRSMELVGRERMEAAVRYHFCSPRSTVYPNNIILSNNYLCGVKPVMTTCPMSPTNLEC